MPTTPWRPENAPAVRQEFATNNAAPIPVGKPELDSLKAQRNPPPAPTLKPQPPTPGHDHSPLKEIKERQNVTEREKRIQHIQQRLGFQQDRAQKGFAKANVVPKPDPVSKQETEAQKREIRQREARIDYIHQRLAAKRDRARGSFNRSR